MVDTTSSNSWSKSAIVITIFLGYLSVVRFLRWRRYNEVHKKYAGRIDILTPEEAQKIMHLSSMYDMPSLYTYSLSFALFKTYAIPSISKILARTKEFSSKELVSKRYADTEILISTWVNCPISGHFDLDRDGKKEEVDPRAMIALARVNWLHSRYKISNGDYLYTMCLFILEPIAWASKYGWRPLSSLECQAIYIYWVEIGRRMGIEDIPESLAELEKWRDAYAEEYMKPATSNRDVAGYTIDELLHSVPERLGVKAFLNRIIICVLEEPVRIAMMQPAQPWYIHTLTKLLLALAGPFQRHLCLPRSTPESLVPLDKSVNGFMHPKRWQAKPWYKPKATGLQALIDRFVVFVGYYDDLPGPAYKSEGYRLEEMGPAPVEKSAHEEIMRNAAKLQGCPVTGVFSLQGRS